MPFEKTGAEKTKSIFSDQKKNATLRLMRNSAKTMKKAVILNDTSYEYHHGCETVIANIKKLLRQHQIAVTATNPVNVDWRENPGLQAKMAEADLILVNGEGSLHHARPRAARLIAVAEHARRNWRISTILINTTCQENGPGLTDKMKFFTRIYVRESFSQKELEKASIPSRVVPDMSFYTRYDLGKKPATREKIGVTDSVSQEISEYLYELSRRRNYLYLPTLSDVKLRGNGANLIPYIIYQAGKRLDYIRFRAGGRLKHKKIKRFFYLKNYREYIQTLAGLRFLITGRFHALCFALKTSTPFIAIPSNSFKMESLIHDIGLEKTRIQTTTGLETAVFTDFSRSEQEKIRHYVASAPAKIEEMFKEIRDLIS